MPTASVLPEARPILLTADQIRQYREEGYCLLPDALSPAHLELLRSGSQAAIDRTDAEMDRAGTDTIGINRRNNRYFSIHPSLATPALYEVIYGAQMTSLARQLLGPEVFIFWEQYVIKAAETGMHFSWHQDSGYVDQQTLHNPYLSCWCALDDMSEANGTIYVLPYDRAGTRARVAHVHDPVINDLVGYHGQDSGVPIVCPAGSIALFSSVTFHRSGANHTNRWRRSYLIQYADQLILRADGTPWGRTEPVLHNGVVQPSPLRAGA